MVFLSARGHFCRNRHGAQRIGDHDLGSRALRCSSREGANQRPRWACSGRVTLSGLPSPPTALCSDGSIVMSIRASCARHPTPFVSGHSGESPVQHLTITDRSYEDGPAAGRRISVRSSRSKLCRGDHFYAHLNAVPGNPFIRAHSTQKATFGVKLDGPMAQRRSLT